MAIHIVQLGSPRAPGEGPRLGTVRRPPRGVPKSEFARRDYYDLWLPLLSPPAGLVKFALGAKDEKEWNQFARKVRAGLSRGPAAELLSVLALLSHHSSFSLGCYCQAEARCHRSILRELLLERGAAISNP